MLLHRLQQEYKTFLIQPTCCPPQRNHQPIISRDSYLGRELNYARPNGQNTSLTEVQWWSDNILLSYKHIRHPAPNVVIHTDASSVGWGARIDEATQTAGIWSQFESAMHKYPRTLSCQICFIILA